MSRRRGSCPGANLARSPPPAIRALTDAIGSPPTDRATNAPTTTGTNTTARAEPVAVAVAVTLRSRRGRDGCVFMTTVHQRLRVRRIGPHTQSLRHGYSGRCRLRPIPERARCRGRSPPWGEADQALRSRPIGDLHRSNSPPLYGCSPRAGRRERCGRLPGDEPVVRRFPRGLRDPRLHGHARECEPASDRVHAQRGPPAHRPDPSNRSPRPRLSAGARAHTALQPFQVGGADLDGQDGDQRGDDGEDRRHHEGGRDAGRQDLVTPGRR